MSRKVETGIWGLDYLLHGGIVAGHTVLIQGMPGAGKTTMGVQVLSHGAEQGEAGLIVTFEERGEQLKDEAAQLGIDLQPLIEAGKLEIVTTSPDVFRTQIGQTGGLIEQKAKELDAKRIMVDSISHFQSLTSDPIELRQLVTGLLNMLRQQEYTTVLTQEISYEETGDIAFEQYVVDTVVRLLFLSTNGSGRQRHVEVLKARGSEMVSGRHRVEIGRGGISIYPRPTPRQRNHEDTQVLPIVSRASTGIIGLDRMMGGGLVTGSATLAAGEGGTGKSILGLHFLSEGVKAGEKVLLISLSEDRDRIVKGASTIGIDMQGMLDEGKLVLWEVSPVTLNPDRLYWDLRGELQNGQYQRVVLDSLTDIEPAIGDEIRIRDYVYALVDLFSSAGVTSMIMRQIGDSPVDGELVESDISMVFDTIIAMRLRSIQDHVRKTLCVFKMRASEHDSGIRQFKITERGFHVETKFEGASSFLQST